MSTSTETLRQVPPFAPPAGFRWLRRGEIVKSTDYRHIPDQPPREADSFSWSRIWLGTQVGLRSADLGDRGDSIRLPFCRPAPVTPLLKADPKTGRRPPVLGLHFGAWFWYEQPPKPCGRIKFPGWFFLNRFTASGACGFADWATHYVEAGDDVNKPAPLRDDQRELRYLAAEKRSVKAAMAADVKSTLLSHASDSADVMAHFVGLLAADQEKRLRTQALIRATLPSVPHQFSQLKYNVSTVPIDPPKKAKLPTHKVPHCPAGWRKLVAGETVLDSDLYWSPDNVWTSRLGTKRVGKPWQLGCRATIRKEGPKVQPVPTVKVSTPAFANTRPTTPGDGYRFLGFGEKIVEGDEFWSSTNQKWEPAQFFGQIPGAALYRRKLSDTPIWSVGDLVVLLPTWHGAPDTPSSRTNPVWGQPTEPGEKGVYVVGTVTANRAPAGESNAVSICVEWGTGSGCIYSPSDLGRYKEAKLPHWAHPILPDKKPAQRIENAIQPPRPTSPGDGYVFLYKGDTIEQGDEFWDTSSNPGHWRATSNPKLKVVEGVYRRKVPAADSPLVPGDGYRLLYDFEVPGTNDDYINLNILTNRQWRTTGNLGASGPTVGTRRGNLGAGYGSPAGPEIFAVRRKLLPTEHYLPGWRLLRPDEALKAGDHFLRSSYRDRLFTEVGPNMANRYGTAEGLASGFVQPKEGHVLVYRNISTE